MPDPYHSLFIGGNELSFHPITSFHYSVLSNNEFIFSPIIKIDKSKYTDPNKTVTAQR
ncbi:hypothetical protein TUM4644_14700 [Shewanella colwelliana]|nr:hypothetical protein TUM4644_14700 [Shewanella colwelliana]